MSHGGKGDKPRPFSVPLEQFDKNFDAIFGKKKKNEAQEIFEAYANRGQVTAEDLENGDYKLS